MLDQFFALDGGILLWIQSCLRIPALNGPVRLYTPLGNAGLLFLTAAVLLLCIPRTRKAGAAALIAIAIGFVCTNVVLKHLISRPRPWLDVAGLTALVEEHDPNSFPSGHTCAAFAFAGALWHTAPRKWIRWTAVAAAVLMGLSRLYVGVHYPSDVIAGALVGLLSGWAASRLLCRTKL